MKALHDCILIYSVVRSRIFVTPEISASSGTTTCNRENSFIM